MRSEVNKPKHNMFDNIYELRMRNGYGRRMLEEILRTKPWVNAYEIRAPAKPLFYHASPGSFIHAVLRLKSIKHPVWKVIVPPMKEAGFPAGSIYYIVESEDCIHFFRGTYDYEGSGPHQSAVVEEFFDRLGFTLELRTADYLLSLLGLL